MTGKSSDEDTRGPEFHKLLAERKTPAEGKGTPAGIIAKPVQLPPMVPIKDAGEGG